MIDVIQRALENAFENQPADFLLATKQEDYLTYRISSELTNSLTNSIAPTQFKRFDIAELSSETNQILKIVECKYLYSSDFAGSNRYGEDCTRKDFEKLAGNIELAQCERYLLHFVIHFNNHHLETWSENFMNEVFGINHQSKYFTYLGSRNGNRIDPQLQFRNTQQLLFSEDFVESYKEEIESYNLNVTFEGSCQFDFTNAAMVFCNTEISIPHQFHCFLWKISE